MKATTIMYIVLGVLGTPLTNNSKSGFSWFVLGILFVYGSWMEHYCPKLCNFILKYLCNTDTLYILYVILDKQEIMNPCDVLQTPLVLFTSLCPSTFVLPCSSPQWATPLNFSLHSTCVLLISAQKLLSHFHYGPFLLSW